MAATIGWRLSKNGQVVADYLQDRALAQRHGPRRGTSVQSGIADAVFQVTGKRYRDLPLRNHDLTWG
jgi:hypothetical protein